MAAFDYAVKYALTATCISPLRTGGTDGDVELVLLGSDGLPIVQGSSIAGVLRSWVQMNQSEEAAEKLFGASRSGKLGDRTSLVTVSDGAFRSYVSTQLRPRLRMNRETGTGMDSQKFSVRSVESGSRFDFELLLQTKGRDAEAEELLEKSLSALHSGQIALGGQSANGFGLVELSVKRRSFDLKQKADRQAWLEEAEPTEALPLKKLKWDTITFTVTGTTSGVLIRSGERESIGEKHSVATAMRDAQGSVLPGSALKGLIRSRAEQIGAYLGCSQAVEELFGSEEQKTAGRLRVREGRIKDEKKRVITRTRISRFTGGVMEKKLFSEEPVSGEVCIEAAVCSINVNRPLSHQSLGVLFYAMRDLAMGLYSIGSESSIGRGCLTEGVLTVQNGEQSCTFRFEEGKTLWEGDAEFVNVWLKALEGGGQA